MMPRSKIEADYLNETVDTVLLGCMFREPMPGAVSGVRSKGGDVTRLVAPLAALAVHGYLTQREDFRFTLTEPGMNILALATAKDAADYRVIANMLERMEINSRTRELEADENDLARIATQEWNEEFHGAEQVRGQ